MSDLEHFRKMKDQFYKRDPNSPLTSEQRESFEALNYFPENAALRLRLPIEVMPEQDTIEVQTSTGDIRQYVRYGKIHFEVEGQSTELTLYLTPGDHGYFLPFTDATSGTDTYGGGRYLDIEPLPGGQIEVDFNLAYNPYCAYSDRWSCPLVPAENHLKLKIEAGEKKFKETSDQ